MMGGYILSNGTGILISGRLYVLEKEWESTDGITSWLLTAQID